MPSGLDYLMAVVLVKMVPQMEITMRKDCTHADDRSGNYYGRKRNADISIAARMRTTVILMRGCRDQYRAGSRSFVRNLVFISMQVTIFNGRCLKSPF